jgi:cell division protease FtsH
MKRTPLIYYLLIFLCIFFVLQWLYKSTNKPVILTYDQFKDSLDNGSIKSVTIGEQKIKGIFKSQDDPENIQKPDSEEKTSSEYEKINLPVISKKTKRKFEVIKLDDDNLIKELEEHNVEYKGKKESKWFTHLMSWILPFLLIILIWVFIFRRVSKGMNSGQNIFNIGRNKAKLYTLDKSNKVTFDDVAGVDEAKDELSEMIEFLKKPGKYTRLGGKLPKGVLLVGPPGTGKTLLARAVAGEADVPFFSITGSDFIEMFAGVGAARVRDLFKEAKTKEPCIIFIDEIDAIGKSRGHAIKLSANDERENTLNQLLSEMDGFTPGDSIILIGSTNRPEVLDKALLRPGRFDRQILVDRPDLKGRQDILKVHTRNLTLADETDLNKIASRTPGFSGADLANICNEAALLASRKEKQAIELNDFQEAIERVIAGLEKKSRLINPKERKIIAYHESGHAIVGHLTPGADPVQKVSIVPRGIAALGYTLQTPLEDRFLMSKNELLGKIKGMLGGRAAEEITFNDISTGASNDLERVTQIVYDMITIYGMGENIPNISLKNLSQNEWLGLDSMSKKRSEKTEQIIDEEALKIIQTCYDETKDILIKKRDKLDEMARTLLEKEVLSEQDVNEILGERND